MLQIEPAVLLDVKAFVLDLPTAAATAVGQAGHVVGPDREVGDPGEEVLLEAVGLPALESPQQVLSPFAVHEGQLVHPPVGLLTALPGLVDLDVPRAQLAQGLVLLPDGRQATFLEDDDILPVVLLADVYHRPFGVQSVQEKAQAQLGEVLLESLGQPVEGFQLAVLLGGVGVGVLDELRAHGDRQPLGRDQLGLQDVVVVVGRALDGLFQAMRAVAFSELQLPRAVQDDQEVSHQPAGVEDLHPHQAEHHLAAQAGELGGRDVAEEVVERVVMGELLLGTTR